MALSRAGCWAAACLLCVVSVGSAAPPKVNYLFPAGVQRGQSVVVTAGGEFTTWPLSVWCDRPGITVTAEQDKGKFRIAAAEDAAPGVAWLRVYDAEGAAALRPFLIGSLPEVEESEPNDAPGKPQKIAGNVVVNGRLAKAGDVDGFAVELKRGETLTAALQAHTLLGSPLDAVLQVCDLVPRGDSANDPSEPEAFIREQNHDGVGLDPWATFTAPREGTYLVRLFAFPSEPNSTIAFAGGDNYVYRLTLTTGEFDPALGLPAAPLKHPVLTATGDSQRLELPATIVGKLAAPRAQHTFPFAATKGQKLAFRPETQLLGLPTEVALRILDERGGTSAEVDGGDPKKEVELVFTPPADGNYTLLVRDTFRRGGPRFGYRVVAATQQPDFAVSVATDAFVLSADKPLEIPLTIDRRFGFNEPLEIRAVGLPAGITADEVTSAPTGDSAKSVKLILQATKETPAASTPFTITAGAAAVSRPAQFVTTLPLDQKHESLWLTVRP